ncbi:transcription factor S-II, central domain-containing protein [Pyronema omphalodes]|nr:transcription factor S-II, central domain-containing protein [Pyronema omphalodes]
MDAKDVMTHVSNIDKAVRDKLPADHLIDLLKALQTGVVATEKLLRETKVGMSVNKLRAHTDKNVAELAKEIVTKWKNDVHLAKNKASARAAADKPRSAASPTTSQRPITPDTRAGSKPVQSNAKAASDPMQRNKIADNVNCSVTGDKARDSMVGILYDALCIGSNASPDLILSLAKDLENAVFGNYKCKIDPMYKRRIQTLFLNLKNKANPNLRARVISGDISTTRLATMDTKEMASEEMKKENERLQQENLRESMVAKAEKSISDQLQCGKCGKKRVSYTQAQTRSADEPMTTFCTCENCGHMWKFS